MHKQMCSSNTYIIERKMDKQMFSNTSVIKNSQGRPIPVAILAFLDPQGDAFMKVASAAYNEHLNDLVQCQKCERKFFPDRIVLHESSCAADPIKPQGNRMLKTIAKPKSTSSNYLKEPLVQCKKCGRKFFCNRIERHEPTCAADPIKLSRIKPQGNRMLKPIAPPTSAYFNYLKEFLVPCKKCGRKFFPDRIVRHESSCAADPIKLSRIKPQGNRMLKPIDPPKSVSFNYLKEPLVQRRKCGRKFFPHIIERHEPTCAADLIKVKVNVKVSSKSNVNAKLMAAQSKGKSKNNKCKIL